MKRLLILAASFGDGQYSAARNLSDAIESLSNDAQVEVLDLLSSSSGPFTSLAGKAYDGLLRLAPALWGSSDWRSDTPLLAEHRISKPGRLRPDLGRFLLETQPDVVVCTHPAYAAAIHYLYRDYAERPFRLVSVITEGIRLNPDWLQCPADWYCVPDESTAAILRSRAISAEKIKTLGFPVSSLFCHFSEAALPDPGETGTCRILYVVKTGVKKLGKNIKALLELEAAQLTIAVGRNAYLKARLTKKMHRYGDRVRVLGWTNQMPYLMMTHHLLVGKAGTALVREAIAARCPMIASQVSPGSEEDNAQLLIDQEIGGMARKPRELAQLVKIAFKGAARPWRRWRENLDKLSRPDAAILIARLLLDECESGSRNLSRAVDLQPRPSDPNPPKAAPGPPHYPHPLLCDFHIHTNYSDGKLSVAEVIDFYGRRHFDCICITDHLADSRRLIGKLGKLSRLTISPHQLEEYFEVLDRERRRAWRKYSLLVMAGIEFNKDGLTKKSSAHLLGIDLRMPIIDCLDLPETIAEIHAQDGLAVASHPHIMKSEWGKDTLYLWENQERFAPLLDAWEVANRNNMFNPVSTKRLPYLANSDFHKPKHIYSWKTLVSCDKNPEAIKACIRKNQSIAITLYRDIEAGIEGRFQPLRVEAVDSVAASRDEKCFSALTPAA